MGEFRPRDESPLKYYEKPAARPGLWILITVLILAAAAAGYYLWRQIEIQAPPLAPVRPAAMPAPAAEPAPAIRHPIETAQPEAPLPPLQDSDAAMREWVSALIGGRTFDALLQSKDFVRRVVATVDNLPRRNVPTRIMAHKPVPGAFTPGAGNARRYAPYVNALESLDTRALVERYRKSYPLFQQAYAELGFPDRYFNDRLVEAIDDMLAAPELAPPPELVQPKVFYQYADPALEARSAGQKIMMRVGAANAAKVKAKLREIRAELVAGRQTPDARK
jgi:hypothetical protein